MIRPARLAVTAAALAALLVAADRRRFVNVVRVRFDRAAVSLLIHRDTRTVSAPFAPIAAAHAVLSRTMTSEVMLSAIEVEHDGLVRPVFTSPIVQAWGVLLSGHPIRGRYPGFTPTFGDWTMDRARSTDVTLALPDVGPGSTLALTFEGRGDVNLRFERAGAAPVEIGFNDGYIDNASSICVAASCQSGYSTEARGTNLRRLSGLAASLAAAALAGCPAASA